MARKTARATRVPKALAPGPADEAVDQSLRDLCCLLLDIYVQLKAQDRN